MARTKEFNRDKALMQAMLVFWEHGYEATSTDDLLCAMGIGRQSMYDTFGDKHRLYIEALRRYQTEYGAGLVERLQSSDSAVAGIEALLLSVAAQTPSERARGCMTVNAISELAQDDTEVATMVQSSRVYCEELFTQVVHAAKRTGEVAPTVDERAAGRFILSTIQGLRISAKAGATPEALRDIAAFAIAGLKSR